MKELIEKMITDNRVNRLDLFSYNNTHEQAKQIAKEYSEMMNAEIKYDYGDKYEWYSIERNKIRLNIFFGDVDDDTPF